MSTIWRLPETKKGFWHQICACKLVNLGLPLVFHRYFTDISLYRRLSHRYYYVLIVLYLLNFSDAVILTHLRKIWLYVSCLTIISGFSCTACLGYWKILQILTSTGMKTTRTTVLNVVKERGPEVVRSKRRQQSLLSSPCTRLFMAYWLIRLIEPVRFLNLRLY